MVPEYRADIQQQREVAGCEMANGIHHCLVVSSKDFNDANARGVVVIPMTSARNEKGEKFSVTAGPWVRVISEGTPAFVLCEQIRYIDRRRHVPGVEFQLGEYDLMQIRKKLELLLLPMIVSVQSRVA